MFFFFLGFIIFNFLITAGYSDILRLYSDQAFNTYALVSSIIILAVFFSCPSIMKEWLIGVFIYEIIGFSLFIKYCLECNKKSKDNYYPN